jgi:SAM-dependent methyltransferase
MKKLGKILLAAAAIVGAAAWIWRWISRRYALPTPYWISWFFESPLVERLGRTEATLDHIGLRPGERVLDVGSGPGRISIPAARRVGPSGTVTAIDIQPGMLARLEKKARQENVTNLIPKLGDITKDQSLPDNYFDRAWLVTVLGEIPDREAAFSSLFRLLKPGGTLSITEILPDPHFQSRKTVLRLGESAGFKPSDFWGSGWTFTQNFEKPA